MRRACESHASRISERHASRTDLAMHVTGRTGLTNTAFPPKVTFQFRNAQDARAAIGAKR